MLKASDIMTEDVALIRGSATVAEAIKLMNAKPIETTAFQQFCEDHPEILAIRHKIVTA
jgi:CBS domain-containing protein